MKKLWRNQMGLTLVEVMVSVVILSMIMLAATTALRTFGHTYDRLRDEVAATSLMREVHYFLRQTLAATLDEADMFVGTSNTLMWAAPLDRVGSAGGIQVLRLEQQGNSLILSFAPWGQGLLGDVDPDWGAVIEDFVLLERLDNVRFEYQEMPSSGWESEYNGEDRPALPALVSIRITVDDVEWPPILVRPIRGGSG